MEYLITRDNLCAVVVWYSPTPDFAQNIYRYADNVRYVFIIDNSDTDNREMVDSLKINNVCYHFMGGNNGIAPALNVGFDYACKHGAAWVLTMDQDSIFEGDSFADYLQEANDYPGKEKVGIFAVRHNFSVLQSDEQHSRYTEKKRVMCSGNLVSVAAYKQTGQYREDFFLDWVDFEFCVRIKDAHYSIIECSNVTLKHFLGEQSMIVTFFGLKKHYANYPVWRKYFAARNMLRTARMHKSARYSMYWRLVQEFKQVLLYDKSITKWRKLRAMSAAAWNARKPVSFTAIKEKYQ